jgi:hypothetical protein
VISPPKGGHDFFFNQAFVPKSLGSKQTIPYLVSEGVHEVEASGVEHLL